MELEICKTTNKCVCGHNGVSCMLKVLNVLDRCGEDEAFSCFLHMLNSLSGACHCGASECGEISLAYGEHQVTVATKGKPKNVLLGINNAACDTPVCQGDINMVGYTLLPDGFVLYADIKSNTSVVTWVVEY